MGFIPKSVKPISFPTAAVMWFRWLQEPELLSLALYMKNMKRPPGLFSRRSFIQFLQHILLRLQNHFAGAAAEEASVFQYRMPVHINVDNAAGFKVRLFLIDP